MKERQRKFLLRSILFTVLVSAISVSALMLGAQMVFDRLNLLATQFRSDSTSNTNAMVKVAFPVGVDPVNKTITEQPFFETYREEHIDDSVFARASSHGYLGRLFTTVAQQGWFQQLASPMGRTLVIRPGERKEEIAERFGDILNWDDGMKDAFIDLVIESEPALIEGKFSPAAYVSNRNATPEDISFLINHQFTNDVADRYPEEVSKFVPLQDALTIASLIEREAYDWNDMRYISGVIWNRLFIGMNLQLDATLQYAKGSRADQPWWPRVVPKDKYIDSAYNTYENEGLPPAPIANPSLDAILAALNPRETDCMYYFHDPDGGFHCSVTYEEHVENLKAVYGRGK